MSSKKLLHMRKRHEVVHRKEELICYEMLVYKLKTMKKSIILIIVLLVDCPGV